MEPRKKVLIVDDSPTCRLFLKHVLEEEGGLTVVATAQNGKEAVRLTRTLQPDVITMDIRMPQMDGIEASRHIMATQPTPIVMVSDFWNSEEVQRAFDAMEIGAVAGVQKPAGFGHSDSDLSVQQLVRTVRLMSEIRVVRRFRSRPPEASEASLDQCVAAAEHRHYRLVAMGASTGGPPTLKAVLSALPATFPLPVLIVQHIAVGFLAGMVEWIQKSCPLHCRIARQGETIRPETVYFAPDDFHMVLGPRFDIQLLDEPSQHGVRPSVSVLFRSLCETAASQSVAVLLTGMGKDGAAELKALRDHGALTVAQDQESSVVYGMPGEAARLKAADHILSPPDIARLLSRLHKPGDCNR